MIENKFGQRLVLVFLAVFVAGMAMWAVPRLYAAFSAYVYPPDKDIVVNRSFEPGSATGIGLGDAITVTVSITNNEDVDLRGFYYSDQVPSAWGVSTVGVSVDGTPIGDYAYAQGEADEVYAGFTPHRWALELPQGDGVFSPTHAIPAVGGTAQVVYAMVVNDLGSDYEVEQEAWAGWLETTPDGTAVFGYQVWASELEADFTADTRSGEAPLLVSFSDLSSGDPTAWAWDFGDGSPASYEQHPEHTFTDPGVYTVTLTVTRTEPAASDTIVKPSFITVTVPPLLADFNADPRSGEAPLTVSFSDLSSGGPTAWAWDLGDGSPISHQQHPVYTYTEIGVYTVTLTVTRTDPAASDTVVKPSFITVTLPPLEADFVAAPRFGLPPLSVRFTDLSMGDILTYSWDFGDAGSAVLPEPVHVYNDLGYYTVTLTVWDAYGSDTLVQPRYIHVVDTVYTVFLPVVIKSYAP